MTKPDPYDLVKRRARIRVETSGVGGSPIKTIAEGRVFAYDRSPRFCVVSDDGTSSWIPEGLVITDLTPPDILEMERHGHVCGLCSSDGLRPGPGCANCRNTGMSQMPCQAEGHQAQCPHGCCPHIVAGWKETQ